MYGARGKKKELKAQAEKHKRLGQGVKIFNKYLLKNKDKEAQTQQKNNDTCDGGSGETGGE